VNPIDKLSIKNLINPVALQGWKALIVGALRSDLDKELKGIEDTCLDTQFDQTARMDAVKVSKKALKKVKAR